MDRVVEQIQERILAKRLLRDRQKLLAAVSGGLDSMVLLHVLHRLSARHRWKLTVAHFNHQLRGAASERDERLVRAVARQLNLPLVAARADVGDFAKKNSLSLEMAGRKLRHEFFAATARARAIPTVALAHHADDQVELFFLRLLRGAGGDGLAGMKWKAPSPADRRIVLVRPLLDQPKEVLQEIARRNKIEFSDDATNACVDIQRNRIRHELIPLLRSHYQPALGRVIARLMDVIGAEAEFAAEAARRWLQSRATGPAQEMEFSALPPAVQRRVIQLQLMRLKEPLDFELLERLRASANQSVSAGPQRFLVRREDGRVCLEPRKAVKFDRRSLEVDLSKNKGEAQFHDHRFRWRISRKAGKQFSGRENVEYFDCDKVGGTICLRCWNAGDRFQPAGMPKPVKVQDLFVNLKVPSAQRRARIVATTSTGELFWVEGLRISERFKLEERTVRRLKWSWRATRPLGPRKNRFGGLGVVRTK